MNKQTSFGYVYFSLVALILSLLLCPSPVQAHILGGEPPRCDPRPCHKPPASPACPPTYLSGGSALGLTEGNLQERYRVSSLKSATGATIDFSLTYNSYNADNSRGARVDTVLGYGWTHSYNIFLFSQGAFMFRMDGDGRVTRYQQGPDGTF